LTLTEDPGDPGDVIICYGGDGTLLSAELKWPNIPKIPLRNSRRGFRCISDPPDQVIAQLVENTLIPTEHLKLECQITHADSSRSTRNLLAINEFTVHMGHVNAAVRFKIWFDEEPFGDSSDAEIIGDGFMVSTPFGSTAYFNEITRGTFWSGIGVAFMYAREKTNHVVLPEDVMVRAEITRGPAILAYDNAEEYVELAQGDRLHIKRFPEPAIILAPKPSDG
jgi:NAD+ kinase